MCMGFCSLWHIEGVVSGVYVGNVIRELCLVRDNELACELSPIEVNAIINELCIN